MAYNAWFQCINGCPGEFDLREVIYRCPTCGDLLEVQHDMDALRSRSAAAWIQLFDDRYRRNIYPTAPGSGQEGVGGAFIDNENIVSMYEGTPTSSGRPLRHAAPSRLWVKLCGNSHTGSFKDLGMTVLVSLVKEMMAGGTPIDAVACASTGDTSAALGAYCAAAGIPSVVLLPKDRVSIAQLVQPLANGALVLSLDTDFDGCMAIVQEITKERRIYLANSRTSCASRAKTVASRSCSSSTGRCRTDRDPGRQPRQRARARAGLSDDAGAWAGEPAPPHCRPRRSGPPSYRSFQEDFKRSIRSSPSRAGHRDPDRQPVSVKRAIRTLQRFNGVVEQASEQELADEAARADRTGISTPAHRVALAALRKLVAAMSSARRAVVVLSTANGLKFADQKAAYHMGALEGIKPTYRNKPVELPADAKRVARAIARHVEKSRQLVS